MVSPTLPNARPDLADVLRDRRRRLAHRFTGAGAVVLWSGQAPARNFAANRYPFRASSHFLYFAGLPLERAAILLEGDRLELFWDEPTPAATLWHGPAPHRVEIARALGADAAFAYGDLKGRVAALQGAAPDSVATVGLVDPHLRAMQAEILGRPVSPPADGMGVDRELALAIVATRLVHDADAIAQIRHAAAVTVQAHRAGMLITDRATHEVKVRAAIEAVIYQRGAVPAYNSIVTIAGEVLHNERYDNPLLPGDLLLVDAGAEAASGWASDVTRTWPVSGEFSPTQRAVYDVVLAAHDACIAELRAGVEYQKIHLLAAQVLAEGLVELGILRGQPEDLVDCDAHALFFPHGVGHLLGLDVHDMEDLGDLAGYAEGRRRSERFGLGFLRLNRPIPAGAIVTIEPGFYQVPAILEDRDRRDRYAGLVDWERLAEFKDVRGIRIEDDVLVTATGSEVLTADLPVAAEEVAALVRE
ncbi:MAG: aminopeptidase P family protein [Cyanobacteria bacterium]|nr:aminopeptidase P family protein [Cyanobacteriota bacterium]